MYKTILNKIFTWNQQQACDDIFSIYEKKWYCIVDYLYFATIVSNKLFDVHNVPPLPDLFREALLADYKSISIQNVHKIYQQAILDADVVLPDGIALQCFYALAKKKRLSNLNGTDFCPYFLSFIQKHYPQKHLNIFLYGTYPHLLQKTKDLLHAQGFTVVYAQDGYTHLDWHRLEGSLKEQKNSINVLLVARSTPVYPIQEIRTLTNKENIKKNELIVMNQWGTFDFWVGEQKRAPKLLRTLKLERLRRLILDPQRNSKKVLSTLSVFRYILSYLILKKE